MFRPTQRTYTNIRTNKRFRMYHNDETDINYLLNESTGEKITSFVCSAFTGIDYILKNGKKLTLTVNEFFPIAKNNPPVKKKFIIQKRYSKI